MPDYRFRVALTQQRSEKLPAKAHDKPEPFPFLVLRPQPAEQARLQAIHLRLFDGVSGFLLRDEKQETLLRTNFNARANAIDAFTNVSLNFVFPKTQHCPAAFEECSI